MWKGAAGDFNSCDGDATRDESEIGDLPNNVEETTGNEKDSNVCSQKNTNHYIERNFYFLEDRCSIGCMDTDGVFLVTAGMKQHEVKVWDVETEKHIQQLSGHIGPITGLKLQPRSNAATKDCFVITCSEDGTIRQWSIPKGEEVKLITTANVLTCMGLQEISLVITGNHKGHLEIYHLLTGQLFARESAHKDPIDALQARDNYICTVVYGNTSNLKVWMMKWGKIVPIYCIEDEIEIEFSAFTLSNGALILGEARSQKLHFFSLVSGKRHAQLLRDKPGQVMFVDVMKSLVFAATVENKMVALHVYEQLDFDHLLTFHCKNVGWVSSIIVLRNDNTLKFLVGGSALAVLKLDFNTEKTNEGSSHKEFQKKENREGEEDTNNLKNELTSNSNLKLVEDTTQATVPLSKMNIEPCRESSSETHGVNLNKVKKVHDLTKRPAKLPTIYGIPEFVQQKEINSGKTAWIKEKPLKIKEESRNLEEKMPIDNSKIKNEDLIANDLFEKISSDKTISMKETESKDKHWNQTPFQNINLNNTNSELGRTQYSPLTERNINYRHESMTNLESKLARSKTVPQKSTRKFSKFAEKADPKEVANASGAKSTLNTGGGAGEGGLGEGGICQVDFSDIVLECDVANHSSVLSKTPNPDVVSDITDQYVGCFRRRNAFKKRTTQSMSLKREKKTKKKCSIM